MKMLRDNLLVKELKKEQLGKVLLPEFVKDDWLRGEVIAVGPGNKGDDGKYIKPDVKKGDTVVFTPPSVYGGAYPVLNVDGDELIILPEKMIWAVE